MPNMHLARLLRLISLIRGITARTPADLARELEVTQRTVFRDLKVLGAAGMVCRFDREEKRYVTSGDFFLPPMQLTLNESLALSVLGEELAREKQVPFLEEAWRAVTKIRGQLPAAIRDDVARRSGTVKLQAARVSPQTGCEKQFETLREAIAQTRKVQCTYERTPGDRRSGGPFLFQPYTLYFGQRAWYVIGLSEAHRAERTLKLNRLTLVEKTDRPYGIPDGWTIEKCFGKAWRMMRGERQYAVKVRFDAAHARNVADTLWHPTQTITWQQDGSCLFQCQVDGLDEIEWWVMGHGPHAQVIEPAPLRDRIGAMAEQMMRHYSYSKPDPGQAPRQLETRSKSLPMTSATR